MPINSSRSDFPLVCNMFDTLQLPAEITGRRFTVNFDLRNFCLWTPHVQIAHPRASVSIVLEEVHSIGQLYFPTYSVNFSSLLQDRADPSFISFTHAHSLCPSLTKVSLSSPTNVSATIYNVNKGTMPKV